MKAEYLCSGQPDKKKGEARKAYLAGTSRIVFDYNVLQRGFDAPGMGILVILRTWTDNAYSNFVQSVSRPLRVLWEHDARKLWSR